MNEVVDFYERYIETFNAGDRAGFAGFFHLPLTVMHASRYDDRRAGRSLATVTDTSQLWAPLPDYWARSTIDAVIPIEEAVPFVSRDGLTETDAPRPSLFATVTRWDQDDNPYEHIHAQYVLTREQGKLGIKILIELAVTRR